MGEDHKYTRAIELRDERLRADQVAAQASQAEREEVNRVAEETSPIKRGDRFTVTSNAWDNRSITKTWHVDIVVGFWVGDKVRPVLDCTLVTSDGKIGRQTSRFYWPFDKLVKVKIEAVP